VGLARQDPGGRATVDGEALRGGDAERITEDGELADRHPLISARRTTLLGIVSGQACSLEARLLQRLKGLRVEFTGLMGGRRAAIGLTLQFDGKSE
jgi:hypothetical protein